MPFPFFNPQSLARTPGINPSGGKTRPPIRLPYGAPPFDDSEATDLPAIPEPPAGRPEPPPFTPPGLDAPRAIAPTSPPPLSDYRGQQIQDTGDFQRDQYVRKGGTTDESGKFRAKKPGWKDFAVNALLGFAQGAQADPRNALMAGLGGAGTAGVLTAVNPMAGREYRFAQTQQPGIEAAEAKRRQVEDRARAVRGDEAKLRGQAANAEHDELRAKYYPDQVASEKALRDKQMAVAEAARDRALNPQARETWKVGRNRQTGELGDYNVNDPAQREMFEPYEKQAPMTAEEAEALRAEDEGTQEQIAQSYMQGRVESLKGRLSPLERDIVNGVAPEPTDDEQKAAVARAFQRWQQIQDNEMAAIRKEVAQNAKVNASKFRTGGRRKAQTSAPKAQSGGATGQSRSIKEFNSSKFPGLKFD